MGKLVFPVEEVLIFVTIVTTIVTIASLILSFWWVDWKPRKRIKVYSIIIVVICIVLASTWIVATAKQELPPKSCGYTLNDEYVFGYYDAWMHQGYNDSEFMEVEYWQYVGWLAFWVHDGEDYTIPTHSWTDTRQELWNAIGYELARGNSDYNMSQIQYEWYQCMLS